MFAAVAEQPAAAQYVRFPHGTTFYVIQKIIVNAPRIQKKFLVPHTTYSKIK